MRSAFGIEHGEISKELGFMPMGPRKKASPAKIAELKTAYRTSAARQAGSLARAGKAASKLRRI